MLKQYTFITSSSYSGSTLLGYLMGSHSRIATIGEARGLNLDLDPDEYRCSCGEKFLDCPFWQDIERRMKDKLGPDFSLRDLNTKFIRRSRKLSDRLQFSNLRSRIVEKTRDAFYMAMPGYVEYIRPKIEQNTALAESVTSHYRKDIYLDTSKTPGAITYLSRYLSCEFKVIYLFRDGRAIFNSYLKRNKFRERDAIREWIKINKLIQRRLKDLPPDKLLHVRYSDLCAQPRETLERVFNFVGVSYEEQCLNFWEHEHHIIGNPMRLSLKKGIVQDESWKKALSPAQLDLFGRIGGRYNEQWNRQYRLQPNQAQPETLAASQAG